MRRSVLELPTTTTAGDCVCRLAIGRVETAYEVFMTEN